MSDTKPDPTAPEFPAGRQTIAQLIQQGLFHHRQGQTALAMERYSEVLQKNPEHPEALYYVAVISCQEGQYQQGVNLVRRALTFTAPQARMLNLLGQALDRLGQPLDAMKALDQAIALDPNLAAAHGNRANILIDAGLPDMALQAFDRAIALDPTSTPDLINRGALLELAGQPEDALKDYDAAIKLAPNAAETYCNRASVLKDLGLLELGGGGETSPRFAEAIASYDRAIKIKPRMHEAYAARGQIKLQCGDWPDGFADYDHRAEFESTPFKAMTAPRWHGEPRPGERIVLVTEQGLGDIIQFGRFAAVLASQGHDIAILPRKGMAALLSSLKGVTVLRDRDELERDGRPYRWLPLMSAPTILGVTPDTMPPVVPYLAADPARVAAWAGKLGHARFKIGINWSPGNPDRTPLARRDIPLTQFAPLAKLPGVEFIALQKGAPLGEIKGTAFRDQIKVLDADPNPEADYFLDTAAIIEGLDLVIGCDAVIAHLAGALGKPVFTALPAVSDWRWMLGRDDSPWYPTMRLFRQDASHQWSPVFERIAAAVKQRLV